MTESAVPATDTASLLTLILALTAALVLLAFEPASHRQSRPRPIRSVASNGKAMNHLLGRVTRAQLAVHPGWRQLDGSDYAPDEAALARLGGHSEDVRLLVFLGTWCIDSVREVPRFWGIVDRLGLREEQVTLYALDRNKRDTEGLAERWGIVAIPTFIVLAGGRELGRVVERPQRSLEEDLLAIAERRLPSVRLQQNARSKNTPY